MLNYETLLSNYDDKLTLLQFLKKVEAALADASAISFSVTKTGNATLKFVLTFADGSTLESPEIVLQQGESVASAAIVNGHLILTLTNGDELDAGSMFNGNVAITGTLSAAGNTSLGGDLDVAGTSEFHDAAQFDSDVNVLGDLAVSGVIAGKVNPDLELNANIPIPASIGGLATNPYYCKLIAKGGLLHVIICFDIINDTPSPVTLHSIFDVLMDAGYKFGALIYDANGNNLAQSAAAGQSANIATIPIMYLPKAEQWTGEKGDIMPAMMWSNDNPNLPNRFVLSMASTSGLTIPANTTYNFTGRITLNL